MTHFSICEYITPLDNGLQLEGDRSTLLLLLLLCGFSEVLITVTAGDYKWHSFLHQDPYPAVSSSNLSAPFNKTFLKNVRSLNLTHATLLTAYLYHIIIRSFDIRYQISYPS